MGMVWRNMCIDVFSLSADFSTPAKFHHIWHTSCRSHICSHGWWCFPCMRQVPGLTQLEQSMGGISLCGSNHSVIKTTPRHFLEGKEIHPNETMCLWPRGHLGHGKQGKVSGADRHSTKQILQLPISELLNGEQEFLQVLLCSQVTNGIAFLLPCLRNNRTLCTSLDKFGLSWSQEI